MKAVCCILTSVSVVRHVYVLDWFHLSETTVIRLVKELPQIFSVAIIYIYILNIHIFIYIKYTYFIYI